MFAIQHLNPAQFDPAQFGAAHFDNEPGLIREPDWQELRTVVTNHGPKSEERLAFRRLNWDDTAWVRSAIGAAPGAAA